MMQSAAYNQKVPENFSGDCTWWQSRIDKVKFETRGFGDVSNLTHQVYEGFGDNKAGNEGKANYDGVCH